MRTLTGFALAFGASLCTLACSDEGATPRAAAGSAGQVGVSGSGGAGGSGAGGSAGSAGSPASAGAAGTGAAPVPGRLGEPLELIAGSGDVPYAIGDNPYGIRGGAFLARSAQGNTVTVADEPGEICISGNLAEVPNGNYSQYWGVEFGFNLNQGAPGTPSDPADAGAVDAGIGAADAGAVADAAPPAEVAQPWRPGEVIGFSYVIEGPTINLIRFKALPAGYDRTLESSVFCKSVSATSGVPESSLFSEMSQYCWSSTMPLLPASGGLDNISWQLPADVAPAGERPFDWCLKELRPILAE